MELIIIIIAGLLVYFIFNSIHTKKQQKLQRQKELFIYQQNEQKLKLEYEKRKNDITDFVKENEILIKKLIQEYPLSSKSFNNYNSYSNYKIKLSNF